MGSPPTMTERVSQNNSRPFNQQQQQQLQQVAYKLRYKTKSLGFAPSRRMCIACILVRSSDTIYARMRIHHSDQPKSWLFRSLALGCRRLSSRHAGVQFGRWNLFSFISIYLFVGDPVITNSSFASSDDDVVKRAAFPI